MKNNENEKAANSGKKPKYVKKIITETILKYKLLSFGIVAAVCLAVIFSLIPPLILGKIIEKGHIFANNSDTWYGDCIFCNAFFYGAY